MIGTELITVSLLHSMVLFVGYITSNGTFPTPLTEKEESAYLERLKQGDEEARNVLIERNLRLVAHIVKKFDNTGEDIEDLISIGTVGLIKAINTFDPSKGTRLATYSARCIENEILMHLRSTKKVRCEVSLYDPIGVDREGNEITLIDVLGSDPDVVSEIVGNKFEERKLREKLNKLGGKEREVLELRYGFTSGIRKTQREIARILGISRSYVSRIEKRETQSTFISYRCEFFRKSTGALLPFLPLTFQLFQLFSKCLAILLFKALLNDIVFP